MSILSWLSNKFNKRAKKGVIYTAITGAYDDLKTPTYVNDNFDYVCFTDSDIQSNFWQIRKMEDSSLDPNRKAKKYKVLPHKYFPEYQYSLWVDGNFKIIGDLEEYIKKYSKSNAMMCVVHPDRDCIYEEANACIKLQKDSREVILKQIKKYTSEGYPKHNRLIAGGILFRKHNDPKVIKVMNDWWVEIMSYSKRDQLSYNYVCWKNNFLYDECNLSYWGNEYFIREAHRKKVY